MPDVFTRAKRSAGRARIRSRGSRDWQNEAGVANWPRVPRKIRQLIADLERAGFVQVSGGQGFHRKFRHPAFPGAVI